MANIDTITDQSIQVETQDFKPTLPIFTEQMSTENENIATTIKQEIDSHYENNHDDMPMEIKVEHDKPEIPVSDHDNPFQNLQVEIKQEISISITLEREEHAVEDKIQSKGSLCSESSSIVPEIDTPKVPAVKNEVPMDETLVSYDYPNFDDAVSMDSNEAAALGNVETCLQEELNIKCENENFDDNQKEEFYTTEVKRETDLTVTDTHITPNNITTSIEDPSGDMHEQPKPKALVVIHTLTRNDRIDKKDTEEEILPTSYSNENNISMEVYQMDSLVCNEPLNNTSEADNDMESFQLNSITGNVLSLEQEAYGLLKAKKKMEDVADRPYACSECSKAYATKRGLRVHWYVHRTIERRAMGVIKGQQTRKENRKKKTKSEDKYISKEPKTSQVKKEVRKEVKKEGYDCTCGKSFQRRSRMETCLRSHNLFETSTNSCVSCMTCTKKFKNKDELALHRKRLHRKRFPCKFCPTDYDTRKELFKHLQIHQKVQLMEYKVISEVMKGKQKLRCFMCSKSYSDLSQLKSHVMNDHSRPYVCPHCKKTFPKIVDFGHHTKTYHPEVEGQSVLDVLEAFSKLIQAWKCEECELQFLEPDKLALHQIEKHSPELKAEPQFQCTDCRRVFISQKGLTSHRRVHHSTESAEETKVEEQGIMCLECRKICKDMTALTSHMRLHSPDRKYPCKFCDFRFATPEKRKAHAEIHTGDMKYVCFICEYQCSSENRLKQHKMSLKHANLKEYLLTGKPLIEEPESSNQEKIKDTLRKKESSVKKKKKDKGEKKSDVELQDKAMSESSSEEDSEVACDICGDMFPSESEMLEHKQTHPFIEFPNDDKPSRIFFK